MNVEFWFYGANRYFDLDCSLPEFIVCDGASSLTEWDTKCQTELSPLYKQGFNTYRYIKDNRCSFASSLNEWYERKGKAKYSIISHYSPIRCLEKFQVNVKTIIDLDESEINVDRKYILLFDLKRSILYFIKPLSHTTPKHIIEEMEHILWNARLFYEIHKEFVANQNFSIIPLLALNNLTEKQLAEVTELEQFKKYYLTSDEFGKVVTWMKNKRKDIDHESDKTNIEKICFRILSHMILDYRELPSPNDDTYTKLSKLLPNEEQMKLIDSEDKQCVYFGSYGTGKTVVLIKKLEKLIRSAKKSMAIYFLVGDSGTLLINDMEDGIKQMAEVKSCIRVKTYEILEAERINPLENINALVSEPPENSDIIIDVYIMTLYEFGRSKQLPSPVNLADVIKKLSIEKSHMFLDEFNGESLDQVTAEKINSITSSSDITESYLYIVSQPLETVRNNGNQESQVKGHRFSETGLCIRKLNKCIRNPVAICKLFIASIEIIKAFVSEFKYISKKVSKAKDENGVKQDENTCIKDGKNSRIIINDLNTVDDNIVSKSDDFNDNGVDKSVDKKDKVEHNVSNFGSERSLESMFDSSFSPEETENQLSITNNYHLDTEVEASNSIQGKIPKLISIDVKDSSNDYAIVNHLISTFKKYISSPTTIICFDKKEVYWCYNAIRNIDGNKVKVYVPNLFPLVP